MYNYLWPVFGPNSIGNANKNSFITLYSNSVRRYSGVLVSESLCLLVKITQSDEVFFAFLIDLVATVALARKFVGLLHSTIAERSNETIKPATLTKQLNLPLCFKIAPKKLPKLQNYVSSVVFRYITDFFYDE